MKTWLNLAILVLAVLVVIEAALWRDRHRRAAAPAPGGEPAPALVLRDIGGREVSLAGLRGQVVMVNFWATWCAPCLAEIPDLTRLYAAHRGRCFELLGVAEESGPRDVETVARRLGVNYPVLLDQDRRAGDDFGVPGYPRTYLVDAQGRIRSVFDGSIDRDEVERALQPLLAEAPPACRSAAASGG